MDWISKIALLLLIVGGINWGLIGLLKFDFISFLFGPMGLLSRTIYILVGLSAIWTLLGYFYPSNESLQ